MRVAGHKNPTVCLETWRLRYPKKKWYTNNWDDTSKMNTRSGVYESRNHLALVHSIEEIEAPTGSNTLMNRCTDAKYRLQPQCMVYTVTMLWRCVCVCILCTTDMNLYIIPVIGDLKVQQNYPSTIFSAKLTKTSPHSTVTRHTIIWNTNTQREP